MTKKGGNKIINQAEVITANQLYNSRQMNMRNDNGDVGSKEIEQHWTLQELFD
jgi:hypothetical protein